MPGNFNVHRCICGADFSTGAELAFYETHHCDRVEQIAASLTPAAVERLMQPGDGDCNASAAMQFVGHDLLRISDDGEGWDFNSLGLAVRDHLSARQETRHGE